MLYIQGCKPSTTLFISSTKIELAGSMHAPHLILRLRVGAERQQILHSFPLACLRSLMQRSLPIALHCLAGGVLCQWICNAKPPPK